MNSISHFLIRCKNAFHYKVGLRIPYSKIRIKALRSLGHNVGNDVYFPADLVITQNFVKDRGLLSLGDRVSIGPGCIFVLASHPNFSNIRETVKYKQCEITICDDAWIGAGVIILPGITIGKGAIVGAGSVVTKSVEPFSVVAGNPAKEIKKISQ